VIRLRTLGTLGCAVALMLAASWLGPSACLHRAEAARIKYLKAKKFKPRHGRTFVNPEAELRVRFNRPLDENTISSQTVVLATLSNFEVAWTYRLEKKGKMLVIVPDRVLDPGTDYRIEVRPGIAAADGSTLKRVKGAQFFTENDFKPFPYLRQEQFSFTDARLSIGRAFHGHCELEDRSILLTGGQSAFDPLSGATLLTDSADLLDADRERIVPLVSRLQFPRAFHPSAALPGGALVIGGWQGQDATAAVDRYDAARFQFAPARPLQEVRDFHAAVGLPDGRVLVTGGLHYLPTGAVFSDTAEIYDPGSDTWRFTFGAPVRRRGGHALTLLHDGRVLISGGEPSGTAGGTIEFFDPDTETFRSGKFTSGSARENHALTVVNEHGDLIFADGGSALVEFLDPETERFAPGGVGSVPRRTRSTASLLPNGQVLIAGGFDMTDSDDVLALRSLDLYVPGLGDYGRVLQLPVQLNQPRAGHSAHVMPSGRIFFIGGVGVGDVFSLATIEQLEPVE
jgi:hypothetical protein